MSYYLGSGYNSYRSSYDPGKYSSYGRSSYGTDSWRSSYSKPSYDSSSWRNSYSSSYSSSYTPRTYDFGSSSLSSYSSRYGDSSWRTRDYTSNKDSSSKEYSSTTENSKDYLSNGNSTEESSSKDDTTEDEVFAKDGKKAVVKDFNEQHSSNDAEKSSKKTRGSFVKEFFDKGNSEKELASNTKGPLMKDFSSNDRDFSKGSEDSSREKPSYRDREEYKFDNKTTPGKKMYDLEDVVKEDRKDNALFEAKESDFDDVDSSSRPSPSPRVNADAHGLAYRPQDSYTNQRNKNPRDQMPNEDIGYTHPKTRGRTSSDSGPVSLHRPEIQKFISVVPEENRYITSVNYLPDRIELRLCGATPTEKKLKKWRSIPDMYNITLKPQQSDEEQISCEEQTVAFAYDSGNELLGYHAPKHEHMKEMYVTQYTHHFDPEEPRSHIAGWKVDVEPNGVPHERSRMCVLKHPVVSGPSKRRPSRPKSAPPMIPLRPDSPEEEIHMQRVDVVDASPRSSRPSDSVFYNGIEDSTDASSLGYAPSDDTSDSSAFIDPRSPTNRDSNFSFSKPRLIRLSAEFPGIRNLEKMRRKRQSMGSATSPRPRSSLGHSPSPRDGEYGFFVALTSGDSPQLQSKSGRSYSNI